MGTKWSAVVDVPLGTEAQNLGDQVQARLDAVDEAMSTWKAESELSRFNRAQAGEEIELSQMTADVLSLCGPLAAATGGAFDPTVGPLVRLWGFGTYDDVEAPTAEGVMAAKALVDWPAIRLTGLVLSKTRNGVELDLSAIAKGHAADLAAEALLAAGCESFLLEVGGEMVLRGKNPSGVPWQVGVIDPLTPSNVAQDVSYHAAVSVTGAAVATSGDYRNVREVNGRIVAHAIDPRTGYPIEHSLASVTVVADTCARADALATAALVLGPEKGLRLLESQAGVEGYLLSRVGQGEALTLKTESTSGMEALLMPPIPQTPKTQSGH